MLFAIMAVRNEADRWLHPALAHLEKRGIQTLVCDDRSTDDSVSVARQFSNVVVTCRPENLPSFLQHEGHFRQWCWTELAKCGARKGDWVLSIDADEFLIGETLPGESEVTGWGIHHPEVWGFDSDGTPVIRTDGFWGDDAQLRLAPWRDCAPIFPDRAMGSGSLPLYARDIVASTPWLTLLHYGYARHEDRIAKYERYMEHSFGHNPTHIASILVHPTLKRWEGEVPCLQPA